MSATVLCRPNHSFVINHPNGWYQKLGLNLSFHIWRLRYYCCKQFAAIDTLDDSAHSDIKQVQICPRLLGAKREKDGPPFRDRSILQQKNKKKRKPRSIDHFKNRISDTKGVRCAERVSSRNRHQKE